MSTIIQAQRPDSPEAIQLIDELEAYEFEVSERGAYRTSAPSGMHDDCAMALSLAAWEVRPSRAQVTQARVYGMW